MSHGTERKSIYQDARIHSERSEFKKTKRNEQNSYKKSNETRKKDHRRLFFPDLMKKSSSSKEKDLFNPNSPMCFSSLLLILYDVGLLSPVSSRRFRYFLSTQILCFSFRVRLSPLDFRISAG